MVRSTDAAPPAKGEEDLPTPAVKTIKSWKVTGRNQTMKGAVVQNIQHATVPTRDGPYNNGESRNSLSDTTQGANVHYSTQVQAYHKQDILLPLLKQLK